MTSRRDAPYVAGLLVLTMATGAVDAVAYLALGEVFAGNMTGNVLFVGFALAGEGGLPVLNTMVALGGFVLGVVLCGRLVRGRDRDRRMPTVNLLALGAGAAAVVGIGAAWLRAGSPTGAWVHLVTGVLAVTMGSQAAAVRGAHVRDVSTVVVTTTLVNLALDSPLVGGTGDAWVRRAGAVVALAGGALLGALSIRAWSGPVGLLVAGALMAVGAVVLTWARRHDAASVD